MRLEDYDTTRRLTARVEANRALTPGGSVDIHELELKLAQPAEISIGQSLGIILEGPFDGPGQGLSLGHDTHFRLYTVADLLDPEEDKHSRIRICVQRCDYIDSYSGESYPGIASNYLCDLSPGATLTLCGPYGIPWTLPEDHATDLVLIGAGTGAAPYRAMLRQIRTWFGGWDGHIWLLRLARREEGLFYLDELQDVFSEVLADIRFEVSSVVSRRPHLDPAVNLEGTDVEPEEGHLKSVIESEKGCIFVSGPEEQLEKLDDLIALQLGSSEAWQGRKTDMMAQRRWQQLVY